MKIYIIITMVFFSIFSCTAQRRIEATDSVYKWQYYTDSCKVYTDYTRRYINDSIYVERSYNLIDTFIVNNGRLFITSHNTVYKIVDTEEDFKIGKRSFRYYYSDINAGDTIQRPGEADVSRFLRLAYSVNAFVPVKEERIGNHNVYLYYLIGDCYPVTKENCIESQIVNGRYTTFYFEKGVGFVGYKVGDSKCRFIVTDESYKLWKQRK
ncbi:hypothetical protein C7475_101968 [Chitinophaga sp. S165]|nr:hypothetical protein C7475_101968 [Chitinophaga sp. S165]